MDAGMNDGGPVFPCRGWKASPSGLGEEVVHPGLTLRDLFAGVVLFGMLVKGWSPHEAAGCAYPAADEALSHRGETGA
jgi:hypothetical protein